MAVASAVKPVVRLGFVYHPVGMIQKNWIPETVGTNFEITPTMKLKRRGVHTKYAAEIEELYADAAKSGPQG